MVSRRQWMETEKYQTSIFHQNDYDQVKLLFLMNWIKQKEQYHQGCKEEHELDDEQRKSDRYRNNTPNVVKRKLSDK